MYGEVEASPLIAKLQGMTAPIVPEPGAVYPESAFEAAITEVVRARLDGIDHAVVVPRFGLDIAVFRESAEGSPKRKPLLGHPDAIEKGVENPKTYTATFTGSHL